MNATVKRKFNALLQGIGSRPSTDRDSSTADLASSPASLRSSTYRTMAGDSDLDPYKKRRVGAPTSTPTKYSSLQDTPMRSSPASIRAVPPSTTISNITLRKWTPGTASPAPDGNEGAPPPPKYCPGDRDQLLRRLATFQELTDWTPKPERVSEIEWAKRGWVCQGKERVRCTLCGSELAVKVNRKEVDGKEISVLIASEIAESVVDKYAELIIEAHAEDCLWRKKGCDDSLLRLPLPNPKLALQGLRQRYDELSERAAFLPYESSIRLPPTLNLDTVISFLPPTFFTDPPPRPPPSSTADPSATPTTTTTTATATTTSPPATTPQINRPALALALCGWQSLTHPLLGTPVPNSASCHTCLRRLGLWMFRPRARPPPSPSPSSGTSTSTSTSAAAAAAAAGPEQQLLPAPMDHLDPVREHRFFCPWKNPAVQRNPGKGAVAGAARRGQGGEGEREMAAWEVLVVGLRNEAFIRDGRAAVGHGRSKSSVPASSSSSVPSGGGLGTELAGSDQVPKTPERPVTMGGVPRILVGDGGGGGGGGGGTTEDEQGGRQGAEEDVDDEEARKKKDVDMMARLRRVKSLFNTKAGSRLKKLGGSRPGTSHSNRGAE
ncbi:uncharacterized protein THITE_135466 [Thermothielavioides terrestris NRRL 8126]|uniref:C3HC-type domain-containing protein n=1 Tax=Thermothielavioides terrestris (strain ATCC 38088 / NRRL 8126) TaxID=578455 RepID=G2QXG9_THETT|nr:uncharacterized protein THITE_135466 [Thermothielavioides terrestris NRRL 8126]AEO63994.1 hypothetical protein THITE_135466 [Thermothielavioides terrestris NRRL 8126]